MKHNGLMTLVWVILASIFCGTFYGIAQNYDSVKRIWEELSHPDPPYYPQGMKPETYPADVSSFDSKLRSTNGKKMDSIILYPNKLRIWTHDTLHVFQIIGNRDYIKSIHQYSDGEYFIDCSVEDAMLGRNLRDSLKNSTYINFVENFGYSTKDRYEISPTGSIMVTLYNEDDSIPLKGIADSLGLKAIHGYNFDRVLNWEILLSKTKDNTFEIAQKLNKTKIFKSIGSGYEGKVILEFTYDSLINQQWGLYNLNNISEPEKNKFTDLSVSKAWNYSTGNKIKICIVDYGFDVMNQDLKNKIIECFNPATGEDSITYNDTHGTACAGVAAAIRNNFYGISGVAPDSELMLTFYSDTTNTSNGFDIYQRIAGAIDWAWWNEADIISCSWSASGTNKDLKLITDAITRAQTYGRKGKGCIVVKSSGNTGDSITFPGNYPGVITVGSIDQNTKVSSFSSYGSNLWVVAPGEKIIAPDSIGGFQIMKGTSFAAPAIAGLAALILEAFPDATAEEVRNIIALSSRLPNGVTATSSKKIGNTKCPWNEKYGFGLPNAYKAVDTAIYIARQRKLIYPKPENP